MSIQVPNTLSDLELMARKLGIFNLIKGTKKYGGYKKEDLIVPIRNKLLSDKYGSNIPTHLQIIQSIKSPMLSKRIEELNSDLQDEIWNSNLWYFEEKVNGVRCIIVKTDDGVFFFSRENSRSTLMPIEMPIKVDISDNIKILPNFILDSEVTSENPNTCLYLKNHGLLAVDNTQALELILVSMNANMSRKLQDDFDFKICFNVFDCIYYSDKWLLDTTLGDRRLLLENHIVPNLKSVGMNVRIVNHTNTDKKVFYNKCINSGLEGCIAKRLESFYVPDSTRNSKGWIKIKKVSQEYSNSISEDDIFSISNENSLIGDTIDAFITGFEVGVPGTFSENLIQSVELSVYVFNNELQDYKLKKLGTIPHIEADTREFMSYKVNNTTTLNPACYNAVVELDSTGSMVLKMRYDKSAQECVISEELYKQISKIK